ncbi:hypothetical protein BTS2_3485 [Bacillus sp. TS-2]|nr:hypothetical protein BTS2_3485 [Bacillus sp. TS-2]
MNLFKAHTVHPETDIPLVIYFNKRDGYMVFERDEEVITILKSVRLDLWENDSFLQNLENITKLCKTQFPVQNFDEVYEILSLMGISKSDVQFKQMILH